MVKLIQCDTDVCPDQGTTSGSQSTPTNFNERNLAQAAATAREALAGLAATRLGATRDQLSIDDGVISVKGNSSKRVTYAELLAGKNFNLTVDSQAKRKPGTEWKVLGKPVMRLDMVAMATGAFEFVHNVRVPGMLHGVVLRPPAPGASLTSVDEASVANLPGVVKVVTRKNFVGLVAEKPWQARQAASKLAVTWTTGAGLPSQRDFYDYLRKQPSRDAFVVNSKDVGREAVEGGLDRQGHLSASLSDARLDGDLVRGRRRAGQQGDGLVADAVRVPDAQRRGDAAWPAAGQCARRLRARCRLLRHQRRRHGVVRRGAPVAGGGQAGSRAVVPAGRDGMGELRLPVCDRSTRWPRCRRHDRGVGLRGVVRVDGRPARHEHARQRRHRNAGGFLAGAVCAARRRRTWRALQQRQQCRAVVCGRPCRRRPRAARAWSPASAC